MLPIERYAVTLSAKRFAAGHRSNGHWVDGGFTTFSFDGSAQPASPREMLLLPEGQRTKQAIRIYTKTELVAANETAQTKGDRVLYAGYWFEVQRTDSFGGSEFKIPHWRVIAVRVELDNLGDHI